MAEPFIDEVQDSLRMGLDIPFKTKTKSLSNHIAAFGTAFRLLTARAACFGFKSRTTFPQFVNVRD